MGFSFKQMSCLIKADIFYQFALQELRLFDPKITGHNGQISEEYTSLNRYLPDNPYITSIMDTYISREVFPGLIREGPQIFVARH